MSDVYGRKPIFMIGIVIFLIGSALSGLSQSVGMLILFRGIQGIGAGSLFPVALAIIGDLFSPQERGKYQGLFGGVFGIAFIVGPLVGAFLTENVSWHWIFYVNIPIGIVSLDAVEVGDRDAGRQSRVAGRLEDAVYLERLHELRGAKENLERPSADGISAERAVAWLRELSETWRAAEVPAERADLLHAIYDRITVAGRRIVSVMLTPSAYAHGFALALPEKVELARPTGVGRALATYEIPIEGKDEWLAAARRLA